VGLDTLADGMARAFGPVRLSTIMPRWLLTDISTACDPEAFEKLTPQQMPLRGGRPHEIIGATPYLASDASSYTTGAGDRHRGGMTSTR
jgi:NAD(P)-dependent dehydrogenase (short-subunit alcohol dehydrogenase family)